MANKLSQMTWAEVQREMDAAGSPEKIIQLGKEVYDLFATRIDNTNQAEFINAELILKKVLAEIKQARKRHGHNS